MPRMITMRIMSTQKLRLDLICSTNKSHVHNSVICSSLINKKVTPAMCPSLVGSNPSHTIQQIFDCSDLLKALPAYKGIQIEMHGKVTVTTLMRVSFNLTLVFFKSAAALSTWNFTTKTKNALTFALSTSYMHACNLLKDGIHQPDVVVAMRTDIKYSIQC